MSCHTRRGIRIPVSQPTLMSRLISRLSKRAAASDMRFLSNDESFRRSVQQSKELALR